MAFTYRTEEYYKRFIELQEKLRKSEEERLKLEMKFNEMVHVTREEEQLHYRKLRAQYKRFLEEDRRRQDRNERILRSLERIDSRVAMLMAKTERFKLLRQQYQSFLDRIYKIKQLKTSEATPKLKQSTNEKPIAVGGNSDAVQTYLQNLSSNKLKELLKKEEEARAKLPSTSATDDKYDYDLYSFHEKPNYANTIADDIMSSIYMRNTNLNLKQPNEFNKNISLTTKVPKNYITPTATRSGSKIIVSGAEDTETDDFSESDEILYKNPTEFNKNLKTDLSENNNLYSQPNRINDKIENANSNQSSTVKEATIINTPSDEIDYAPTTSTDIIVSTPQVIIENSEVEKKNITLSKDINEKISNEPQIDPNQEVYQKEQNQTQLSRTYEPQISLPEKISKIDNNQSNVTSHDDRSKILKENLNETQPPQKLEVETIDTPTVSETVEQQAVETQEQELQVKENNETCQITEAEHPVETSATIAEERKPADQYDNNTIPLQPECIQPEYNQSDQAFQQYEENAQSVENYDESQVMQHYDATGEPAVQYDENAQFVQQYDEQGQPIQPYNQQYDEQGQPIQYDEQGQPIQYDEQGQPIQYDEQGQFLQHYDEHGQPIAQYDEHGQPLQQYDEHNQPILQYDEHGQPISQYDEHGQPISHFDEHGQPIPQYDEHGQLIPQYNENGQPIQQYDEHGQPVSQYDEHGRPILQYDEQGQLLPQYDDQGQPLAQYDEQGQLIQPYDDQKVTGYSPNQQYDEKEQFIQSYDYIQDQHQQQYNENGQPLYEDQQYYNQQYEENVDNVGGVEPQVQQSSDDNIASEVKEHVEEAKKVSNVMEMLDTDTESMKQDTKISHDSDFDFSNG